VPSCANDFLLRTILRDSWSFDGYVVSDCDAVDTIYNNQCVPFFSSHDWVLVANVCVCVRSLLVRWLQPFHKDAGGRVRGGTSRRH
jgi:hypothetical protein